MRRLVTLLLMGVSATLAAGGESNQCVTNVLPTYLAQEKCICADELTATQKKQEAISGFTLVSACNVRVVPESPGHVTGVFLFRSDTKNEGMLRIEPSEAGEVFFQPLNKAQKNSPNAVEFRFAYEEAVKSMLGVPDRPDVSCLEAPANLSINQLSVVRDLGTDYDGTYIVAFRGDHIGAFAACKNIP